MRPVKSERLRAEVGRACRIEYVVRHVIGIRPAAQFRIVVIVSAEGSQIKVVAIVCSSGITGGGNGDALVIWDGRARKLADEPAVGHLVIEHDHVAFTVSFANTAKASPD